MTHASLLDRRLIFAPQHDELFFRAIPAAAAVFVLRPLAAGSVGVTGTPPAGAEPYVSKTANLRQRLQRLLGEPEFGSRKLSLRGVAASVEFSLVGSEFETSFLLYQVLRREFAKSYERRLRLRPAPLIKLHLGNAYPRASVTTRLGRIGDGARGGSQESSQGRSRYYGPFYSRSAAEAFLNDSLDFFLLRRCVEELDPDPAFPGCIYSEMKMCLAPCYQGCTDAAYSAEAARVQAYFASGGRSLLREWEAVRDAASADLDFEKASAIHARMEKLKAVAGPLAEIVRHIDQLNGLIIQRSAKEGCVALFAIESGRIRGPIHFAIQLESEVEALGIVKPEIGADGLPVKLAAAVKPARGAARGSGRGAAQPRSLEARVEQCLVQASPLGPATAIETMEHLALLRRWFYRGSRVGEVFFADGKNEKSELPMRRIVRGLGRVFRGEASETIHPVDTPSAPEPIQPL